ncbi:Protein of unknown function DUF2087 [Paenibacillus curdlanolyticus YK9]|uniref:DUF2087 domain-containing protein n=1 Tax=Paenibacillus curdlanolyticus YK9 TaxID=717606 RepID=E0I7M1_9BACL|nr:DUF2087 domain-containing protein [Paenibacillus curdlanolyticus]EFM11176.1 Protein of unknown function DUF2087 [Paenibacillus curdlanolyticus YK9]
MHELTEQFWSASLSDLKRGFTWNEAAGAYVCLMCGESFEDGAIYSFDSRLYEARKAVAIHGAAAHDSMLDYLLKLDKKTTGLTDLQKELIGMFAEGLQDAEIVKRTGGGSTSTIRNHRFALKEKAKQAKLFLTIMELLEEQGASGPKFVPIHRTATQVDERYAVTQEEYGQLIARYLPDGPEGPLESFPVKEKRRLALLRHMAGYFERNQTYTEKEVNERLKTFSEDDYVMLRRYLIEYGFLDRKDDGSAYWVKG